jgi:hypothetical protein
MRLRLAFISFIVVGVCSSVLLVVLQCSSTQTIIRDKASSTELKRVQYSGGSGDSYETAVVIGGIHEQHVAVPAEYHYINKIYGEQDKKWKIVEQTLTNEGDKVYDMIQIEVLATGEKKILYFNVTKFKKKRAQGEE